MSDLEADREERDNPINAIIKKRLSSADTSRSDQDEQEAICGSATSEQPSNPNEPQISTRSPRSPRTSSQASKHISPEDLFAAAQEPFDHAHCSDCALTCLMANDCAMNLAAAQHLAQEGTGRLQKLIEMRERARERAAELDSMDWGEAAK